MERMLSSLNTFMFYSIILIELLNRVNSKYILFARDWLENPRDLVGWSNTTTELCEGQIMDANKLVFMLDKDSPQVNKTFINLPNHWSVGIRLDFIIVDNWKGASMTVSFDDTQLGSYISTGKGKKLLICGYQKEEDKYERELCDDSCSKCKGPTNFDCIECPIGLDLVKGQCICNNGFMHEGSCLENCPQFYRKDEINKMCQPDPCLVNCLSCNKNNNKCLLCKEGFNLLYGDCIKQCPSYTQLVNGVCIDEMHNYWNGTYLVKAFFGNDFSYPEIVGHQFQSNFFDDENIIPRENWAQFSDCNNYRLYGGFGLYGRRTQISNEWVIPWYHSSVRIKFFYAQIENYEKDPETGLDEKLSIYLNGVEKWFMTKGQDNKNACGRLDQGEHFGWLEANMTNLKKGDKLSFEVKNNFYDPAWFEGFGLREFTVIVDRCTSNCLECKDDLGCIKCDVNYFMHQAYCLDECPPGYYGDINTMICKECHSDCLECNQKANNNCTKCRQDRYLLNGMCVQQCPQELFDNHIDNTCGNCIEGCLSCTDPTKNTCTGCKGGFYELKKECLINCPEGYFNDPSMKCLKCHNLCLECSGSSEKQCKSCKVSSQTYLFENQCLEKCPEEYYPDYQSAKCLECQKTCKTCTDDRSCTSCKNSLFFYNGECRLDCPQQYFKDKNTNQCNQCFEGCQQCIDQKEDQCTVCIEGYFLLKGKCLKNCPQNYFNKIGINPICEKCNQSCLNCFGYNTNQCKDCIQGSYLHKNECFQYCPLGYIENSNTNTCDPCPDNCQKCISLLTDSCIECKTNSFLYKGQCQNQCPELMFGDNKERKCIDCPFGCKICRPDQCLECYGKNRLGPQDKCICKVGYVDKIGRQNNQIVNCISEKSNPQPNIVVENINPYKLTSRKSYKILSFLQFDIDVLMNDHSKWKVFIPNTNPKAYQIDLFPIQKKKMFSEINQSEIESEQVATIEITILDSSQIKSENIRIEFNDIYSVQNINQNPLSVTFIEAKIPIIQELNEVDLYDQSEFNLGMNYFMTFLAIIIAFILPLYQTINLFDVLQIINHLNFLNVQYPSYLSYFFKIFDVYNLHILPSFSNPESKAPEKFRKYSVDTFFFSNISQSAIIWSLFFALFLISKLHDKKKLAQNVRSLLKKYNSNYKYKIIFTIAFITYCNMILYTFLQLFDNSFESASNSFRFIFCLIFMGYFWVIHYFAYQSTQCSINQIITIPQKANLYNLFYNGLHKLQGKSIYYSVMLVRKTLLTGVLVFSQDDCIKQVLLWALIIGIETLLFVQLIPFKQKSENQILLLSRMLIIFSLICITALGIDNQTEGFSEQGRLMISSIIIVFCSTVFVSSLLTLVYSKCKQKITKIIKTIRKKEISD